MEKPKLLIVDDDEELRIQLKWALAQDYDVLLAQDRKSALDVLRDSTPLTVILDLGLPPHPASVEEGFSTLQEILSTAPSTKVIIVTGRGEKPHALKAIGEGAYDFLSKPVELEELKIILRRAFYVALLEREYAEVQKRIDEEPLEGMLGTDPKIQEVFSSVRKVATTDVPVLITGESGTGKELVARALHSHSGRATKPLVTVDCAALSETLLESELFGHVIGAFTGAVTSKVGLFVESEGGTIFLDEIGNIPLNIQAKLLRVSEEHEVRPVGGTRSRSVDIRVLAATNLDLAAAVSSGSFREDLYYRLRVVTIELPPLRKRREDIPLLVDHLVRRAARQSGREVPGVSESALALLQAYDWPGNVRELSHVLERSVALSKYNVLRVEDLPPEIRTPLTDRAHDILTDRPTLATLKRRYIEQVLEESGSNVSRAAAVLGLDRHSLYRMLHRQGIVFRPRNEPTGT